MLHSVRSHRRVDVPGQHGVDTTTRNGSTAACALPASLQLPKPCNCADLNGVTSVMMGDDGGRGADREIIRRILSGDEAAFVSLVDAYHGRLLRLALVFVSSHAVAEEVVQETWAAVLTGLKSFEGRSSLKTWLFRILTNQAKTRGVREGRSMPFSALGDDDVGAEPTVDPARFRQSGRWAQPPLPWDEDTPEKLLLRQESMELLEKAIGELPPTQRAVLTLRDVEGLDSEEVCNVLDVSDTNQRVLLHRARSKVRRVLEQYMGKE